MKRAGARDRGFNHLTYPQLLERKQKGLRFKCGGSYHQCPDKHLRVLIIEEDDEDAGEGNILAMEVNEEEGDNEGALSLMSLGSMGGTRRNAPNYEAPGRC